jgi:hypothetical protein
VALSFWRRLLSYKIAPFRPFLLYRLPSSRATRSFDRFDELKNGATLANTTEGDENRPKMNVFRVQAAAATCSNPRVRQEWDSYSNSDKQAFISAIRCLQGKPASGKYAGSRSKYDDLTALHQKLTPNVHSNAKFLLWHRYFVWTFEQLLRNQCGFNREMPWWDETKWSGAFSHSSVFSAQWFGDLANVNGGCVPNGVSHKTTITSPTNSKVACSNSQASRSTSVQVPPTPARTACSAKATPP